MAKYIMEFTKTGPICFTSHLDLMRMFKRAFKRSGIPLAYSQGFNPHPKMGFAQPLSLGYWSMGEYIEFETENDLLPGEIMARLAPGMPGGIKLEDCLGADRLKKTLASHTVAAEYMIEIPAEDGSSIEGKDPEALHKAYMDRPEIPAWKRQKKKKEKKKVDIRPMIREITFMPTEKGLYIDALLDSGSASNLSPELIVDTVLVCFGLDVDRSAVSIMRKKILFDKPLSELL